MTRPRHTIRFKTGILHVTSVHMFERPPALPKAVARFKRVAHEIPAPIPARIYPEYSPSNIVDMTAVQESMTC